MKRARRLAKSAQRVPLRRLAGATLIEAVVALALLGVMIYVGTSVAQYSSKVTRVLRNQSERHRALERIASAVNNSQAWQKTLAHNTGLRNHLRPGVTNADVTTSEEPLAVYGADSALLVPATGRKLDQLGRPVSGTAYWIITTNWRGLPGNGAQVAVRILPGGANETPGVSARIVRIFKPSIRQKCVSETAPIIANAAHGGRDGPYAWDRAVVTCPSGYIQTGLNVRPGCGALAAHAVPAPYSNRVGRCYQISASRPDQRAQTGCNAVTARGECFALCCNFD